MKNNKSPQITDEIIKRVTRFVNWRQVTEHKYSVVNEVFNGAVKPRLQVEVRAKGNLSDLINMDLKDKGFRPTVRTVNTFTYATTNNEMNVLVTIYCS